MEDQELTNEGTEPRKVRVYDNQGDFFIELPPGCRMTFGYFNPAADANAGGKAYRGFDGPGSQTMKTTALRVYAGKGAGADQLAAFLGVKGFRDESIVLTRVVQKVTVESRYVDDGETEESGRKVVRELTAAPEVF